MIPTKQTELPAGVMRSAFGGRIVMLVDSQLPFSLNDEMLKLASAMDAEERMFRYWVFSVVKGAFDKKEKELTIKLPNPHLVKGYGFNTYEGAEIKYVELAKEDSGKNAVVRGLDFRSLKLLGKEED